MTATTDPIRRRERWKLTALLVRSLDAPMLVLSVMWSLLIVIDVTRGLSPWLRALNGLIWLAFVLQFAVEFAAAPVKRVYLRKQWVTAVALALPTLRLLRLMRVARVAHLARAGGGVRLARLFGAVNRGVRTLAVAFRQR